MSPIWISPEKSPQSFQTADGEETKDRILSPVEGIYGVTITPRSLIRYTRVLRIALAFSGSSFLSFHGSEAWKALLPISLRAKMALRASLSYALSKLSVISFSFSRIWETRSSSKAPSPRLPSQNLLTKVSVLLTRFERLPISSLLIFSWKSFQVKVKSCFSGLLQNIQNLQTSAGIPVSWTSLPKIPIPLDLLNFPPSQFKYSVDDIWWSIVHFSPVARRDEGNITVWKGILSFPMNWKRSVFSGSLHQYSQFSVALAVIEIQPIGASNHTQKTLSS